MPTKPNKIQPIERFPTKPRADGRFQKCIHGRFYYFGKLGNRAEALAEYERVKADLYAGRAPGLTTTDYSALTVKDLANRYLAFLKPRVSVEWYKDNRIALKRFGGFIGTSRAVDTLRPDDFAAYASHLKSIGIKGHYYNRERSCVAAMLNHADEFDWITRPVKFKAFLKIPAAEIHKRYRLVEPHQFQMLIDKAKPQLKAMLWLAACNGYGATDCAQLPRSIVDLDKGIILHYPRPKTGIDRDSPLTQETVASIKECLNNRRDDPLVFRSKVGKSWHPTSIAHALAKLVRSIPGIGKTRITLGDLRHTFSTYALETLDTDAWKRLMGHKLPGLKSVYVTLLIPRLRAVVEYVGARLTGRQSHPALVPTFAVSVPSPPLETL